MSGNLRERLEQANNGPTRSISEDHSHDQFGTLRVTQKIENQKYVAYETSCSCGASGQRISQQSIASGVVAVCRFCQGTGVAPGDAPRRAGICEEFNPTPTASPRQRAEIAARAVEEAALGNEGPQ